MDTAPAHGFDDDFFKQLQTGERGAHANWKASPENALNALQQAWQVHYPALGASHLQEMASDCRHWPLDEWLGQLGVQLAGQALALYTLDFGDDSHTLVVLPGSQAAVFEAAAQAGGHVAQRCLADASTPPPAPATRLPHATPVRISMQPMQGSALDMHGPTIAFASAPVYDTQKPWAWWDVHEWPPRLQALENLPVMVAQTDAAAPMCIAFFTSKRPGDPLHLHCAAQPRPPQGHAQDLPQPAYLKGVADPKIAFAGADLLLAERTKAWVYRGLAHQPTHAQPQAVLDLPPATLRHGKVTGFARTGDGRTLLFAGSQFFVWNGETFLPTGIFEHDLSCRLKTAPLHGDSWAWMDARENLKTASLGDGVVQTHRVENMACHITLAPAPPGWLVLLRDANLLCRDDMAQLWHLPSQTVLRIGEGALGKLDIFYWLQLPNGHVVVADDKKALDLGPFDDLVHDLKSAGA
ncbi:MAG: hypothetical protein Q4G39_02155 [Brachymonas sp.]|nr:hypothetical protein [Brachymonas sp.]